MQVARDGVSYCHVVSGQLLLLPMLIIVEEDGRLVLLVLPLLPHILLLSYLFLLLNVYNDFSITAPERRCLLLSNLGAIILLLPLEVPFIISSQTMHTILHLICYANGHGDGIS